MLSNKDLLLNMSENAKLRSRSSCAEILRGIWSKGKSDCEEPEDPWHNRTVRNCWSILGIVPPHCDLHWHTPVQHLRSPKSQVCRPCRLTLQEPVAHGSESSSKQPANHTCMLENLLWRRELLRPFYRPVSCVFSIESTRVGDVKEAWKTDRHGWTLSLQFSGSNTLNAKEKIAG